MGAILGLAPLAHVEAAAAQARGSGNAVLREVIVTAEKRSENIQNVPIAITAMTDRSLKAHGVSDVQGLSRLIPNVSIDATSPFSGTSTMLSAYIRGIGQDDFAFNLDPGVGVYVDGVYYARTVGANQNLIDVDRVEVLKGPQGTLFGRNTIGGAISIITHTPRDRFHIKAQVTTGSYDRHDIAILADLPITPTLLTSLTFSTAQRRGFERRIPYPHNGYVSDPVGAFHASGTEAFDTQGGQNAQTVRYKVLWKGLPDLTVAASFDWTHTNESGPADTVLKVYSPSEGAVFSTFYNLCIQGVPFVPTARLLCGARGVVGTPLWDANANAASTRLPYDTGTAMTGNIDTTYATGPNFDKINTYGTALTLDWRLSDALTLRSITGWRELHWSAGSDLSGSPVPNADLTFAEGQRQLSEEVQLLGTALDSRLKYVAGVYYFNESGYIHDYVIFGDGLLQIDGPNSLWTQSYAGYLHADYAVTDKIGLTLGARYSEDRKQFEGGQQELNDFYYKITGCYPYNASAALIGGPANLTCRQVLGYTNPSNPQQLYPYGMNHQNYGEFLPTAGLQYHLTPNVMAYVSYAKGFKSGGWTTRLTNPLPPGSAAQSFGPETDDSYEAGLKSEWFGHRLLVNGDVFYSRYRNIQLTYQVSTSPVTQNAGDAIIKGLELQSQARLGHHLSVDASLGYMDDYYTKVLAGARATTGRYLPKTPKWKVTIGPQWHMLIGNAIVSAGLDYTYTGMSYNDVENTPIIARAATHVLDAKVDIGPADGEWTLTLGGTNLTDDRYLTTGNNNVAGGAAVGYYSAPREWYATVSLSR